MKALRRAWRNTVSHLRAFGARCGGVLRQHPVQREQEAGGDREIVGGEGERGQVMICAGAVTGGRTRRQARKDQISMSPSQNVHGLPSATSDSVTWSTMCRGGRRRDPMRARSGRPGGGRGELDGDGEPVEDQA
jgi:hypothetical protein